VPPSTLDLFKAKSIYAMAFVSSKLVHLTEKLGDVRSIVGQFN
jgi:hypothetical protein